MKKLMAALFVVLPLVLSLANLDTFTAISGVLTLEKTNFEFSGQVKEVVMGLRGNGYITVLTEATEIKVPLSFANPTAVKIGSKVVVSGTKTTFLVPVYIEASGYKIKLRRVPIRDDLEHATLSFKIKKIEVTKTAATIVLTAEDGKEVRIPAQTIPVWKNLKVGDDFKIDGIKRTVNIPENIVVDGISYKLGRQFGKTSTQINQKTRMLGGFIQQKLRKFK